MLPLAKVVDEAFVDAQRHGRALLDLGGGKGRGDEPVHGERQADGDLRARLAPELVAQQLGLAQQGPRAVVEQGAGFGEFHAARFAHQQLDAEVVLERVEPARERGLGDLHVERGLVDAAGFDHAQKTVHQFQVHAGSIGVGFEFNDCR